MVSSSTFLLSSDISVSFQKPNENMINNQQIILNQMNSDSITVKTEVCQTS